MASSKPHRPLFTAIPVNAGDAFLLERPDKNILVDGGLAKVGPDTVACYLKKRMGVKRLHTVVCTHGDADHIGGIPGILNEIECIELWLPASLARQIGKLLKNPKAFAGKLRTEAEKFEHKPLLSLEELGNTVAADRPSTRTDSAGASIATTLKKAFKSCERWQPPRSPRTTLLLRQAYRAAKSIRELFIAALQCKSPPTIRLFDYDPSNPSGGEPKSLVPVNAREVFGIPRSVGSPLRNLALTQANRESLVFFASPIDGGSGVLFSGDSDFSFQLCASIKPPLLVTAPHHGAEDNKMAYEKLEPLLTEQSYLVRSDRWKTERPGKSFRNACSHQHRFCTRCRMCYPDDKDGQCIQFACAGGTRKRHPNPNPRHCKSDLCLNCI